MWIFISILITAAVAFLIAGGIQQNKAKKMLNKRLLKSGLTISAKLKDVFPNGSDFISLNESKTILVYFCPSKNDLKTIEISKIKAVYIEVDKKVTYKRNFGATAARGIVGGLVLGGVGAVVGAMTSATHEAEVIKTAYLVTEGDSGANTYIYFIDSTTPSIAKKQQLLLAEKWVRIIENEILLPSKIAR